MNDFNQDFSCYRGKRVLVTGHTGFKGSWLAIWLHELGAQVFGYSLEPPTTPKLWRESRVRPRRECHRRGGDWALDRIVPNVVRAPGRGEPAGIRNQ